MGPPITPLIPPLMGPPQFNCRTSTSRVVALIRCGCSPPPTWLPRPPEPTPPTVRSDASCMASTHQGDAG